MKKRLFKDVTNIEITDFLRYHLIDNNLMLVLISSTVVKIEFLDVFFLYFNKSDFGASLFQVDDDEFIREKCGSLVNSNELKLFHVEDIFEVPFLKVIARDMNIHLRE